MRSADFGWLPQKSERVWQERSDYALTIFSCPSLDVLPANLHRTAQIVHFSHQHSLWAICVAVVHVVTLRHLQEQTGVISFFFFPIIYSCFPLRCYVYCTEKRSRGFVVPALFATWQGNLRSGWHFSCFSTYTGAFKALSAVICFTVLYFCLLALFTSHIWRCPGVFCERNLCAE